jgi:hypothetical protein
MNIKGLLRWKDKGATSKYYTVEITQTLEKQHNNNLETKQNTMNKIMADLKK